VEVQMTQATPSAASMPDHGVALMTIGDFSRATRLSAKALRFYHAEGLLVPAAVDPSSGYRLYAVDQLADAQVIRTLRDLDVPVDEVRAVMAAPDVSARASLLAGHADRLERQLLKTRDALDALRGLLDDPRSPIPISHRQLPSMTALAIHEVLDLPNLGSWFRAGMEELRNFVESVGPRRSGSYGGLWPTELFLDGRGAATLFVPIEDGDQTVLTGRIQRITLPPVELAVAASEGPDEQVPAVYAALGEYVARHELSIDAPVREAYLRGLPGDPDAVVEIGWPIFRTGR
jgi:DNA-binding transcriptional MerR regulator